MRVSYAGSESLSGAEGSVVSGKCVSSGKTICMLVSSLSKLLSSSVEGAVGLVSVSFTVIEG